MTASVSNLPLAGHCGPVDPVQSADTSHLKPLLRKHVTLVHQTIRGERWWLLENKENGSSFRVDERAFSIIARFDGVNTTGGLGDDAHILVSQLYQNDLIRFSNENVDEPGLIGRHTKHRQQCGRISVKNPLAIRIALWDPDQFLNAISSWRKPSFLSDKVVRSVAWLTLIVGVVIAGQQLSTISHYGLARADSLSSLILLALVYPFVKGIHELAHALQIKKYGGEVHEVGIMLLVFFPVPYVNASASAAFPNKYARIKVAMAGIRAELTLAAIGIIIWSYIGAGLLADVAFSIAVLGGVSTLLFNGNPLLRFDGYFAFSDWLEIPNLASRSRAYCLYLIRRFLLGVDDLVSPVTAHGERYWLASYFLLSGLYRLVILFSIAIFLFQLVPVVGALLALFACFNQLILPATKATKYLVTNPELSTHRPQSIGLILLFSAALCYLLFLVPAPHWTSVPSIVRVPETSIVRAQQSGFVEEILHPAGGLITKGDEILQLANDSLIKERETLIWRINELTARRANAMIDSAMQATQHGESITTAQQHLNKVNKEIEQLLIRSSAGGQLDYIHGNDWIGRFVSEGDPIAHVIDDSQRRLIAVVPQGAISDIRSPETTAQLRAFGQTNQSIPAIITRITPSASGELPTAALGSKYGGIITVDSRDEAGTKALEKFFIIELMPTESIQLYPGSRVMIRFEHSKMSFGKQLHAAVSRLMMREFQ